jgi:HSP20 family protein
MPLRDAMDQLFAQSYITPTTFAGGFPPADLYTTDNEVVLEMAVPGANPDDINVSVTGDTVTVSGEIRHEHRQAPQQSQGGGQEQARRRQHVVDEIWRGQFQRSFTLPIEVDANKADASFQNGILTISMPKSEASKPRKIQVRPGRSTITGESSQGGVQKETVQVQSGEGSQT